MPEGLMRPKGGQDTDLMNCFTVTVNLCELAVEVVVGLVSWLKSNANDGFLKWTVELQHHMAYRQMNTRTVFQFMVLQTFSLVNPI